MTCSSCHDTAGGASGPHGASVKWMLSGVRKAWPFNSAASNGAATGTTWKLNDYAVDTNGTTDNGLFCRNCHTPHATAASRNWAHRYFTSGQHSSFATATNGACVSCHIRVPHGGKVDRLLRPATAAVLSRYAPNGAGGEVSGQSVQLFTIVRRNASATPTTPATADWDPAPWTTHTGTGGIAW